MPGSAWSPTAAGSTSRRTFASRRWIRRACWRRSTPAQVDGYATSLPFTTEAVVKDKAVMLASAVERRARSAAVRLWSRLHAPRHCTKQREKCVRVTRALAAANKLHRGEAGRGARHPAEALREDGPGTCSPPPGRSVSQAHAKDIRVTIPGLEHSQKVSLEAKLLEPKDALKSFDGLYTDEFVKVEAMYSATIGSHPLRICRSRDPAGQGHAAAQRRSCWPASRRNRARSGWRRSTRWPICRCAHSSTSMWCPTRATR